MKMVLIFFFKQKTAYEMRISDWSSDVCSSDLPLGMHGLGNAPGQRTVVGDAHDQATLAGHQRLRMRHESLGKQQFHSFVGATEIGRASCRERVCQYV